nr:MAG TPA: hypothetical protein [Caudoviricetes sp.]
MITLYSREYKMSIGKSKNFKKNWKSFPVPLFYKTE